MKEDLKTIIFSAEYQYENVGNFPGEKWVK